MRRTVRHVLGERPTVVPELTTFALVSPPAVFPEPPHSVGRAIPADWPIYNAPRPLFGHITWSAPGPNGHHFAALDPADERLATTFAARNQVLDGHLVCWHPAKIALAVHADRLKVEFPHSVGDIESGLRYLLGDTYTGDYTLAGWIVQHWQDTYGQVVDRGDAIGYPVEDVAGPSS